MKLQDIADLPEGVLLSGVLFAWTVEPDYPRFGEFEDIATAYLVQSHSKADCGVMIWAKYRGEWIVNPHSTRALVRKLVTLITPPAQGEELPVLIPNDGKSMAEYLSLDAATKRIRALKTQSASFEEVYKEWSAGNRWSAYQSDLQLVAYDAVEQPSLESTCRSLLQDIGKLVGVSNIDERLPIAVGDALKQRKTDYRDCTELAHELAESIEKADGSWCYEGDDLPGQFIRHLKPVIGELQHLRKVESALADALEELMDWQNGPPLLGPKWEPGWNDAMEQARAALALRRKGAGVDEPGS